MNTVTFVEAVGVAPGTTTMAFQGSGLGSSGLGVQCLPDLMPLHVAPNQATMTAVTAAANGPNRLWWTNPANTGTGFGLGGPLQGPMLDNMVQLVVGIGLGVAAVYGYKAVRKKLKR